jgi:P pilus assembly chaperone PapD
VPNIILFKKWLLYDINKYHIKAMLINKKYFLTVVILFGVVGSALSQITISPTNLFISDDSKFGTYLVINNSNEAQEVSVDFIFQYSTSNSEGEKSLTVVDSTTEYEDYSLAAWVRAFPQNFILQPNQRQVVRLRINAQNSIPDRTYFARIKTTSTPVSPPVEIDNNQAVSAQIGVVINQISGVYYKKGEVSTGIEIENIRTKTEDNNFVVLTDYLRLGNSPFLGTITASLMQNGDVKAEQFISTTLFFSGTHRSEINITDLSSGEYQLRVRFESRRGDISSQDIVQMQPVIETMTITIP